MLLVGYFEGLDSERGIEWRCADSLSLREFLLLSTRERSRITLGSPKPVRACRWRFMRRSLPGFWVLKQLTEHGLVKGNRIGVDASTMEANAALRAIMRRDNRERYREMLQRLAKESGIETPTADDLVRLDRQRPGKTLSNEDWESRISEPKPNGILRWKGDDDAKRAYYNNRARHLSSVARQAFKLRAELVERSFALALDRGGMRRAWLRGRDNVQKRYLIHVSGYNLGLIMRLLVGHGTPKQWADAKIGIIWLRYPINDQTAALFACLIIIDGQNPPAVLGIEIAMLST